MELDATAPRDGKSLTNEVVLACDIKPEGFYVFKRNKFVFPEMETINQAAYWDYQRERIYVRSSNTPTLRRRTAFDAPKHADTEHDN